ncbi:hypothetical protein CPC08DRAFT_763982 [Agrocybe pediades]|nr:hypothetical protein CPC08DRAFT_763982 [Agrocybe pediades]
MRASPFVSLLSALFLLPNVLGLPVTSTTQSPAPTGHALGSFVGVRPGAYEIKHASQSKIDIHPGIIVGHLNPVDNKQPVAMISKDPPFNPPQAPIGHFQYSEMGAYGNVVLAGRPVALQHMKPWKNKETGERQTPLDEHGYQKLIKAMEPHKDWKPPMNVADDPAYIRRRKQGRKTRHIPNAAHAGSSTGPGTAQHAQSHGIGPHRSAPVRPPNRAVHLPHSQSGSSSTQRRPISLGPSRNNIHSQGGSSHQKMSRPRRPSSPGSSHAHPHTGGSRVPAHPGTGHPRAPSGHSGFSHVPAHSGGPAHSGSSRRPTSPGPSRNNVRPQGGSSHWNHGPSKSGMPSNPGSPHTRPHSGAPTPPRSGHQQGHGGSSGTRRPSRPRPHQPHPSNGKGKAKQT